MSTPGATTIFWTAKKKIGDGTFDLDSHNYNIMIVGNAQALTANFVGSSSNTQRSDLTNEISGTGYTTNGQALSSVTWTQANGTVTFDAADATWPSATFTTNPKYWVIYDNTAVTKDLVCFGDCDTANAAGIPVSASTFVVSFNAAGIFTES